MVLHLLQQMHRSLVKHKRDVGGLTTVTVHELTPGSQSQVSIIYHDWCLQQEHDQPSNYHNRSINCLQSSQPKFAEATVGIAEAKHLHRKQEQ